jgi:hypothetical protein
MSVASSTSIARITTGRIPTIYNVTTVAAVENSQALSAGTKKITVRARGRSAIQFSFTTGTTNTIFVTIQPGAVYTEDNLELAAVTIFVRTSLSDIVEILQWV